MSGGVLFDYTRPHLEGATIVSVYDLLPDDERKAIVWVREHGGLDEVEKRLMPEGMEWPKVDGKPVDFVTGYEPSLGVLEAVSIYNNGACEVMSHDGIVKNATEIHVATHKALDADGKEIRVGDTVWDVESGIEYEVVGIHTDEDTPVRVMRTDGSHLAKAAKPSTLTHAKPEPDSWERIEEDATRMPGEYCERYGIYGDSFPQAEAMACDLVRRCRALAERGE